jgi:DNA-binding NarL/FixJ family response regulator
VHAPITVLLVDDHQMFAQAVAASLRSIGDIEILGIAASVDDARRILAVREADVVLMDYRLPDGRGTEAAREVMEDHPSVRVVMLTASTDDAILTEALRSGCAGYVNKSESIDHLATAVRAAASGTTAISPETLVKLMRTEPRMSGGALTPRELEVLRLMAQGLGNAEITSRISLSAHTVRNHVQSILEKMGTHSRLEAVAKAIREGIVAAPSLDDQ